MRREDTSGVSGQQGGAFKPKLIGPTVRTMESRGLNCCRKKSSHNGSNKRERAELMDVKKNPLPVLLN